MRGHHNEILAIAMPADGRFALSGGDDFTIRQWDLSNRTRDAQA